MILLSKKNECTGCLACVSVGCAFLKAEYDEEGFIQPLVHEKCNDCGRCAKACPQLVKEALFNNYVPKHYACVANDSSVLMRSSSGGLFSVLALNVIRKKGIVFGAAFNKYMQLKHVAVDKEENLSQLCGSKYLQSDVSGCYLKVKTFLDKGRYVLFCGLPCQIDGLNHYLGNKHSEYLIRVDILCKGAPSPGVFSTYLAHQEKIFREKITNVNFRDKSFGWEKAVMCIHFENGLMVKKPLTQTSFGAAFSTNLIMRESCYQCRYRGLQRVGDLSLGDCWGIKKESKFYSEKAKGVSLLSVNSTKGADLFADILTSINYEPADISTAVVNNSALRTSSYANRKRARFFNGFRRNPQKALLRYTLIHRMLVFLRAKIRASK